MAAEPAARITRVVLKNYKSIVSCDVELRPLTILVGPNGSGKSNFLDALEYVSDALKFGLYPWSHSNGRGGNLITRGLPDGSSFLIEIHFVLPSKASGFYALEIRVPFPGEYRVKRETCVLADSDHSSEKISYSVREGDEITEWLGLPLTADLAPARAPDRLYLTALSGLPMVRPVYDLLNGMSLYHLDLARMRQWTERSRGDRLAPDGANVASVLRRMQQLAPEPRERVVDYLRHITPGLLDVTTEQMGPYEVVEFVDRRAKDDEYGHWRFSASEISDGT